MLVTRIRKVDTGDTDRYGKPVMADQSTEVTISRFAPQVSGETTGDGQVVSRGGGTIYVRRPLELDVRPDDRFEIAGVTYEVDGPAADWGKGVVVVLKRAEYVSG